MSRSDLLGSAVQEKLIDSARRFVLRLSGAINSLKTYPVDHPSLQFSHRGIAGALSEIYELNGSAVLELDGDGVRIGDLRADVDPAQHPHMRDLQTWLQRRDTQTLRIDDVVTAEQVHTLLALAVEIDDLSPPEAREHINRSLSSQALGHLVLGSDRVSDQAGKRSQDPAESLLEIYLELCTLTEDLLVNGPRTGTLAAVGKTCTALVDALAERVHVVTALLEFGQPLAYESRHVANTTVLAVGIAARLGLSRQPLVDLARAVATMDVGMTVLPADVRRSGRELRPQEIAALRTHPLESVRVHLRDRNLDESSRRRIVVAMEQHLGIARDGYPAVSLWPPLHLFSRIAAVCDAYDALTSTTSWRQGRSPAQALAELVPPADSTHDPVIVAELCALLCAFPEACRVRLSSGQTAAVLIAQGPGGLPVVRVEDGPKAGQRLDLAERAADGGLALTIVEVLVAGDAARG